MLDLFEVIRPLARRSPNAIRSELAKALFS
jgi:hypothetical protein